MPGDALFDFSSRLLTVVLTVSMTLLTDLFIAEFGTLGGELASLHWGKPNIIAVSGQLCR